MKTSPRSGFTLTEIVISLAMMALFASMGLNAIHQQVALDRSLARQQEALVLLSNIQVRHQAEPARPLEDIIREEFAQSSLRENPQWQPSVKTLDGVRLLQIAPRPGRVDLRARLTP